MKSVGHTLPSNVSAFKRTPEFTSTTVPAGLLGDHSTKAGVWGVINVMDGQLRYIVPSDDIDELLDPLTAGIIKPQQVHRVEPVGEVRFYVEFWK